MALSAKGKEVDDYANTVRRFQPKFMQATAERAQYEAERDHAKKAQDDAETKLQRVLVNLEKVTSDKQRLERLHEDAKSSNQDVAVSAALELAEHKFQAERDAAKRKLKAVNENTTYVSDNWRETSSALGTLRQQYAVLQLRVKDLEQRASDNIVEIHRMNNEGQRKQLRTMYEQERGLRLDREKEIERKNEEIRSYKSRFSGRETRGSSVPRSPRIRITSRNTSPVNDNGAGGNSNGHGVGGTLFGPRGAHLRDG